MLNKFYTHKNTLEWNAEAINMFKSAVGETVAPRDHTEIAYN